MSFSRVNIGVMYQQDKILLTCNASFWHQCTGLVHLQLSALCTADLKRIRELGSDFGEVPHYQITPILGPPLLHHNPQFPAEPAGLGNYSAESEAASNHAVHCTVLAKSCVL